MVSETVCNYLIGGLVGITYFIKYSLIVLIILLFMFVANLSVNKSNAEDTKKKKELLDFFDKVMVSNTHNKKYKGVEIIDVSWLFAEAIWEAQIYGSISSLFRLENNSEQ